jgi:hypothetical protein
LHHTLTFKKNNTMNFEEKIIRENITSRGGGIEIDLSEFGFEGEKMTAYQNYLGGGLLGKINSDNTIFAFDKPCSQEDKEKLLEISENLKKYLHSRTNPDSEWEGQSYEQNQKMPYSAY